VTRAVGISAAGHRRKEADLGALADRRALVAQQLVERTAHRAATVQRCGVSGIARDQRAADRADGRAGLDLDRFAGPSASRTEAK
jgi:hypothetical protein